MTQEEEEVFPSFQDQMETNFSYLSNTSKLIMFYIFPQDYDSHDQTSTSSTFTHSQLKDVSIDRQVDMVRTHTLT